MSLLAESEKKTLLQIARRALAAAVERREQPSLVSQDSILMRPGGAFVTLFRGGRLRGCIGRLPSQTPLAEVTAHCAAAVASEDPRFPRVEPEELPAISIEISVLSALVEIRLEEIQPGIHGLLVSNGANRGVLLPQVAMQFRWDAMRFLEATCEKAGLPADAWKKPGTRVEAFTAEVFAESEFA